MDNDNSLNLTLTLGRRLLLLFCFIIVCFVLTSIVGGVAIMAFSAQSTPAMRIITVVQDLLVFIVPAVGTVVIVCRRPDKLLAIDVRPGLTVTLAAVATLLVSVPMMNAIISLNESIALPSHIEQVLREMETSSSEMIATVIGAHTIANLIMAILIVGVLAGLSEELLFRGCFQRLLSTGGVAPHAAIWIAAIVFSALHMQFYGFIPRMLLGAFFGYLLYWSRSLWMPVILHITNNTVYLIDDYRAYGVEPAQAADDGSNLLVVGLSTVLTAVGMYIIYRLTHRTKQPE